MIVKQQTYKGIIDCKTTNNALFPMVRYPINNAYKISIDPNESFKNSRIIPQMERHSSGATSPRRGAHGAVQAHGAVGLPGVGSAPALGAAVAVKGRIEVIEESLEAPSKRH